MAAGKRVGGRSFLGGGTLADAQRYLVPPDIARRLHADVEASPGLRSMGRLRSSISLASAAAALALLVACASPETQRLAKGESELTLVIVDAATREPVPARVELLDETGRGHVARDALPILIVRDSRTSVNVRFRASRRFPNPQTGTDQFYSTGRSTLSLPPGRYRLRIWKGLEYRSVSQQLQVPPGERIQRSFELTRWVDMPGRGWYGADDHVHLPRPTPEANAGIHQWMAAEDIHVANLLQLGDWRRFEDARQYAWGRPGDFVDGHHVLVSGQENPRTHFLGHVIILGNESRIHYPDNYLDLRRFLEEGRRQGGLNGFAHFGLYNGAQFGLSLVLPHGLLDFLEVLQLERGHYDIWYKILNTGFRLTPTAGSDYPWGESYPGRERFYTRVRGDFTVEKWIEAVRAGHTFVTNGPVLAFRVNGKNMGESLEIPRPGTVDVEARVLFDPRSDRVSDLEIVENGVVIRTCPLEGARSSGIRCSLKHEVRQAGWLAARASGLKADQAAVRQSLAHSAPVYLSLADAPPLARLEEARRMTRSWIALLDDLETALSEENLGGLAARQGSAQVAAATIRRNRPTLLAAIREARQHFEKRGR